MGRFDLLDVAGLRALLQNNVDPRGPRGRGAADTIADYIEGRMIDDVKSELYRRFRQRQRADDGQQIMPLAIPLAERYIAEAANTYNRHVDRRFVEEDGSESDATREQTDNLKRMLDDARYDETMHKNEKQMLATGASCVWYQAKRGKLRALPIGTHLVHGVEEPELPWPADYNDPDDYAGYVVEQHGGKTRRGSSGKRMRDFVFISNGTMAMYDGKDPSRPAEIGNITPNPYRWPQQPDAMNADGSVPIVVPQDLPLRMLTFWHPELPTNGLLPDIDSSVVAVNQEINVALSSIMDHIRVQGFAIPVKHVVNPLEAESEQAHGSMFPVTLGINESMELLSAGTSYGDMLSVLKYVVQLLAIAKRMSPNDFALEGAIPSSGFAKLIDSLPKLEARQERVRWQTKLETQVAFPRLVSIGILLRYLDPSARMMQPRVKFPDVEFPRSEDEVDKKVAREMKYNLSTPAQMLAEREGITEEEAQMRIDENAEKNQATREQNAPQQQAFGAGFGQRPFGQRFGQRIRQPGKTEEPPPEKKVA